MSKIYIKLTGQIESDLASALNDIIDQFDLTDHDHSAIVEILDDNDVEYEDD